MEDGNQLYFRGRRQPARPAGLAARWAGRGAGTGASAGPGRPRRQRSVSFDQRGVRSSRPLGTDISPGWRRAATEAQIVGTSRHWPTTSGSTGGGYRCVLGRDPRPGVRPGPSRTRSPGMALVAVTQYLDRGGRVDDAGDGPCLPGRSGTGSRPPSRAGCRGVIVDAYARVLREGAMPPPCLGGGSLGRAREDVQVSLGPAGIPTPRWQTPRCRGSGDAVGGTTGRPPVLAVTRSCAHGPVSRASRACAIRRTAGDISGPAIESPGASTRRAPKPAQ